MKKLYVSRHGEASFEADSDHSRPLTERGLKQTQDLLKSNIDSFKDVKAIWASSLLRAQQTAKIYSELLGCEVVTQRFLTPDAAPSGVIRQLDKADLDQLLIVSHQPLVGELASLLLKGDVFHSHPYGTSEVLVFEYECMGLGSASLLANYLPD